MDRRTDDSLHELLIVIALLLILAATAIPNLLRAANADRESFAASSISDSNTPGDSSSARE
jgi:type II secretory pathway pseudopilin PulG